MLLLARTETAESGLAGRYWFSAVNHGKNCRNVTFKSAFFQSLLQRNSNELLSKARGLLSRMEAELVNTPVGGPSSRVKGLPDSIDPNKPSRCDAEGGSAGMGGGVS